MISELHDVLGSAERFDAHLQWSSVLGVQVFWGVLFHCEEYEPRRLLWAVCWNHSTHPAHSSHGVQCYAREGARKDYDYSYAVVETHELVWELDLAGFLMSC